MTLRRGLEVHGYHQKSRCDLQESEMRPIDPWLEYETGTLAPEPEVWPKRLASCRAISQNNTIIIFTARPLTQRHRRKIFVVYITKTTKAP